MGSHQESRSGKNPVIERPWGCVQRGGGWGKKGYDGEACRLRQGEIGHRVAHGK